MKKSKNNDANYIIGNMFDKYLTPRTVSVGGKGKTKKLLVGGDFPCSLQTMWKESLLTSDLGNLAQKIDSLQSMGCDILRFAVPDIESAKLLNKLSTMVSMPLVADIHFDYKLAIECMKSDVAKIRINPGNIGSKDKIAKVVNCAKDTQTPIRIGINTGSLPKDLQILVQEEKMTRAEALVETAIREVAYFDELQFNQVIVSLKASSVKETIDSNRLFASKYDIPLHIGVTEAGPLVSGAVKSAIALYSLLNDGIGSTMRVSLSDRVENEILAGRAILAEAGVRTDGCKLVSCPRCGRMGFDVHAFVARWQEKLLKISKNCTIAVMGCVVNGPGEAKHADIGITGIGDKVYIFKHGEISKTVPLSEADVVFQQELDSL